MAQNSSLFTIMILTITCCLINWGSQEENVDGRRKQSVNFYGTLTTHQDKTINVENLSVARLYKQIPVYEMQTPVSAKTTANKSSNILSNDPKNGIITYLDLSETSEISAPQPDIIWTHQKDGNIRKAEYIEIVITSRDASHTKTSYLIDTRRKLICDRVNAAGPIEMEVPLESIKKLIITGYKQREEKKQSCVPCIAPKIEAEIAPKAAAMPAA